MKQSIQYLLSVSLFSFVFFFSVMQLSTNDVHASSSNRQIEYSVLRRGYLGSSVNVCPMCFVARKAIANSFLKRLEMMTTIGAGGLIASITVGSLVTSIVNLSLLQTSSTRGLLGWGIAGTVVGSTGILLSGIIGGLLYNYKSALHQELALSTLLIGIPLSIASLGLGINSIMRRKRSVFGSRKARLRPWFTLGKQNAMTGGLALSGQF